MELQSNYADNSQTFQNFYPYQNNNSKEFNSNFINNYPSNNNLIHKNTETITLLNNSNNNNNNNSRSNGITSENLKPVPTDFLNNAHRTNLFQRNTPKISPFCSILHHKLTNNNFSLNKSNGNSNSELHIKFKNKHSCEDVSKKNVNIANLSNDKYYSEFLNNICDNDFRKRKSILVRNKNMNGGSNNNTKRKNKSKRVSFFKPSKMEITKHFHRKQSVLLRKCRNNLLTNIHIIDNKSGNSPMSSIRVEQKFIGENFSKEYENFQKIQKLKFAEDSDKDDPKNNISNVNNMTTHTNKNRSKIKKNSTVIKKKKEKEKEKKKCKTKKEKKSKSKIMKNGDKDNEDNEISKSEDKKIKKSNSFCLFNFACFG